MRLARSATRSSLYGDNPDPNTGVFGDFETILLYASVDKNKSLLEPSTLSKILEF